MGMDEADRFLRLLIEHGGDPALLESTVHAARGKSDLVAALPEEETRRHTRALLNGVIAALENGGVPGGDALAAAERLGSDRARQGVPVAAFLDGFQAGRAHLVRTLVSEGRRLGVPADALLDGVTRVDEITTALVHRMVHAHRVAELEMARTTREGQLQMLRRLLHGEPAPVLAPLDASGAYHCVVSDVSDPAVAARLETALTASGTGLCGLVDGRLAALVTRLPPIHETSPRNGPPPGGPAGGPGGGRGGGSGAGAGGGPVGGLGSGGGGSAGGGPVGGRGGGLGDRSGGALGDASGGPRGASGDGPDGGPDGALRSGPGGVSGGGPAGAASGGPGGASGGGPGGPRGGSGGVAIGAAGAASGGVPGVVARVAALVDGPLLVASPPVSPSRVAPLYDLGRRALRAGAAAELTGLRHLTDLALLTATASEPDLGRLLADGLLDGLDRADPFHRRLAETALAHLDHGGRIEATAAALHVHGNTVKYRVRRLHELTGGSFAESGDGDAVARAAHRWWALRAWLDDPGQVAGTAGRPP